MSGTPPSFTFDPLTGHLGHLTVAQQESFIAFKASLVQANLYTPPTGATKASYDEPTLLRFLRARRFDPAKAQKQFSDAEDWRKQYDVDHVYAAFDPTELESCKRFYPRWTGRRDKTGLPLYVYRLASLRHVQKELDAISAERKYQSMYYYLPKLSFVPPFRAPLIKIIRVSLRGFSLGSMWTLRNHLQEASRRLATANYLRHSTILLSLFNSPSFFPTIWGWIKGWFDEGTRSKIHIVGNDPGPVLCELVHSRDLPKVYGGELEWNFEDEPNLDEPAKDLIAKVPQGPATFVDGVVLEPNGRYRAPSLD